MEESLGTRLLRQIKEIGELAGIKTEEYAKISKKRLDVLSLDREVAKEKTTLGARIFDLVERGEVEPLEDVNVKAILERIRKLNGDLVACEAEIAEIREAAQARSRDVRRRYQPPEEAAGAAAPPSEATDAYAPRPGSAFDEAPEPATSEPTDPAGGETLGSDPWRVGTAAGAEEAAEERDDEERGDRTPPA